MAKLFWRAVFFLWGLINRVIYPTKVIYKDERAKQAVKKGAVLIANHQSHKDGYVIPQILGKKVYVVVTRKWYDKKGLHGIFKHLRYIPINLEEADGEWIKQADTVLKEGKSVLIFPEGKLERGERQPFHSGFLLPAKHTGAPVIPMAMAGEYKPFHRQKLIIGAPLELDLQQKGRLSLILKSASDECERQMFALYDDEIGKNAVS